MRHLHGGHFNNNSLLNHLPINKGGLWIRPFNVKGMIRLKNGYSTVANGRADDIALRAEEDLLLCLSTGSPNAFAHYVAGTIESLSGYFENSERQRVLELMTFVYANADFEKDVKPFLNGNYEEVWSREINGKRNLIGWKKM